MSDSSHAPELRHDHELRLIRLPKVLNKTGKSRSGIYGDPTFPKPVKIGPRASAWVEQEVDEWIESRIIGSRERAAG